MGAAQLPHVSKSRMVHGAHLFLAVDKKACILFLASIFSRIFSEEMAKGAFISRLRANVKLLSDLEKTWEKIEKSKNVMVLDKSWVAHPGIIKSVLTYSGSIKFGNNKWTYLIICDNSYITRRNCTLQVWNAIAGLECYTKILTQETLKVFLSYILCIYRAT